jgi:hypothetical protein
MQGNINAFGLIACIVLTIAMVVLLKRRAVTVRGLLFGVCISVLVMFVAVATSAHLCHAGNPFTQWLIPCIAIIVVFCVIEAPAPRLMGTLVLSVAAIGLSFHFSELVHWNGYTGNPNGAWRSKNYRLAQIGTTLRESAADGNQPVSAGWLRDVVIPLPEEVVAWMDGLDTYPRSSHYWHTWLTGIYRTESIPADVWFAGGIPGATPGQLEVRPRDRVAE